MSYSLISTLPMLIFLPAGTEKFPTHLRFFQFLTTNHIQFNKLIQFFMHLNINLILFLDHQHQFILFGLNQLQRHPLNHKPKRYDLMHPLFIVYLYSCLFVTHQHQMPVINVHVFQKCGNT